MNSRTKTIALIAAFALFIALAVYAYGALGPKVPPGNDAGDAGDKEGEEKAPGGEEGGEERSKAPDFTVFDPEGGAVRLSDFFGKPIVLNFWASWCPPCKGEMPEFNRVYEESGAEIIFMMVDLVDGGRETKEQGAQYVRDHGFSFPVYFDLKQEAATGYGINSIPQTFFIDQDGYIIVRAGGAIDAKALKQGIELIK